ncbi:MAG: PKD domain-containing protein [Saprospiraceae bacterium]
MHGYYNYKNFYIDFNNFPPNIYVPNSYYDIESTIIFMSDSSGAPEFYSNGCSVLNNLHEKLLNGDSMVMDDYFCIEKSKMNLPHVGFVLPNFDSKKYSFFSGSYGYPLPSQPCEYNRFLVHHIDMLANQGGGIVLQKNEDLLYGCFQTACANRHANGRDWWVLFGDNQQSKFYRWLFTPYGIQGPLEQSIENHTLDGLWYCGWSEFSPNGEKYMINSCRKGVALYDFDRCTGLLTNPQFIERTTIFNQGATFSSNSKILYTVDKGMKELIQFNLEAPDIGASKEVLAVWNGATDSFNIPIVFGFMQRGADGKIYVWAGGSTYMHVIDFPDLLGINCSVHQQAIKLPNISNNPSLYFPNYRLGPIDESSCDTLGINNLPQALFRYDIEDTLSPLQVTFTDVSSYLPTVWHWDFGDGTMSQDTNPVHSYTSAGTYKVCLIVSNVYAADTFCRQVTVGTSGIHELPALPHARVMPNPFSEEIQVQLPALVGVQPRFSIYDLFGREIKSVFLDDFETTLHLPELPCGVYFWQMRWKGVVTQSGKIVKVE